VTEGVWLAGCIEGDAFIELSYRQLCRTPMGAVACSFSAALVFCALTSVDIGRGTPRGASIESTHALPPSSNTSDADAGQSVTAHFWVTRASVRLFLLYYIISAVRSRRGRRRLLCG
jgi:hypothetical protein